MLACASFQCESFQMEIADTVRLAASILGQRGASKRSPEQRREAARVAAHAKWAKWRSEQSGQRQARRKVIL
jgi:hypothetical protein